MVDGIVGVRVPRAKKSFRGKPFDEIRKHLPIDEEGMQLISNAADSKGGERTILHDALESSLIEIAGRWRL